MRKKNFDVDINSSVTRLTAYITYFIRTRNLIYTTECAKKPIINNKLADLAHIGFKQRSIRCERKLYRQLVI